MISPKQQVLNDMLDVVYNFIKANPHDLEILMIFARKLPDSVDVNCASACKPATAFDFGIGLANLRNSQSEMFDAIMSGMAQQMFGAELEQLFAKHSTKH